MQAAWRRRPKWRRPLAGTVTVVGILGGGDVDGATASKAEALGRAVAEAGWVLLTGGRDAGVMAAASRGAKAAGGLVVGVLPGADDAGAWPGLDVAVRTGMGQARNVVNVLTSDAVVTLAGGAGTLSEVALAVKHGRPTALLGFDDRGLLGDEVVRVETVAAAMAWLRGALSPT